MADAYSIARSLVGEFGEQAKEEVKRKITRYTEQQNFNALKSWYEVQDALEDMLAKQPQNIGVTADADGA